MNNKYELNEFKLNTISQLATVCVFFRFVPINDYIKIGAFMQIFFTFMSYTHTHTR